MKKLIPLIITLALTFNFMIDYVYAIPRGSAPYLTSPILVSSLFGKYSLPIIIGSVVIIALVIFLIVKHKKK